MFGCANIVDISISMAHISRWDISANNMCFIHCGVSCHTCSFCIGDQWEYTCRLCHCVDIVKRNKWNWLFCVHTRVCLSTWCDTHHSQMKLKSTNEWKHKTTDVDVQQTIIRIYLQQKTHNFHLNHCSWYSHFLFTEILIFFRSAEQTLCLRYFRCKNSVTISQSGAMRIEPKQK